MAVSAGVHKIAAVLNRERFARREIENAPDPVLREKEIEEELRQYGSPFRTAEAFAIEDVIDPRETRPYLCDFIEALQGRLATQLGPRLKAGVRP